MLPWPGPLYCRSGVSRNGWGEGGEIAGGGFLCSLPHDAQLAPFAGREVERVLVVERPVEETHLTRRTRRTGLMVISFTSACLRKMMVKAYRTGQQGTGAHDVHRQLHCGSACEKHTRRTTACVSHLPSPVCDATSSSPLFFFVAFAMALRGARVRSVPESSARRSQQQRPAPGGETF
jgi:hypothetical protein